MQPAADASVIDTTDLDVDDVVARVEELVRARAAGVNRADAALGRRPAHDGGRLCSTSMRARRSTGSSASRRRAASCSRSTTSPGSTCRPFGAACPRTIYYMAKIEADSVPGLGQLIRAHRGVLRAPRRVGPRGGAADARDRRATAASSALFVEGTRQKSGVPGEVQPGAAMVAIQESVPVVPGAVHGSQTGSLRQLRSPCSIAWGEPMRFDGLPAQRRGLQRGDRRRSSARSGELWDWLAELHELGPPRAARRRRDERDRATPLDIVGTVAIVGFPNVGKSTLVNRLTEIARGGRPRDAGGRRATARSSSASGTASGSCSSTRAASTSPTASPITRSVVEQARAGRRRGRPRAVRRRRPRGRHARRRGARRDPPQPRSKPVIAAREQDRRPAQGRRRARVPPARARRPGAALGAARPRHAATCSTTIVGAGSRTPAAADGRGGGDPRRDPRPAERRQVVALQRAARRGAGDRLRGARARRATRSTRCSSAATRRFVLVDTAGLRRKRKQRQGIEYYSELRALEAAERADVALVLIDAAQGIVEQRPDRRGHGPKGAVLDARRALEVGRLDDRHRGGRGPSSSGGCASARRSSPSRRRPAAGSAALLDRVEELFDKHDGPDRDTRAEPLPRRAPRGAPAAVARRQAAQPALRRADPVRPPRFRFFVNDPGLVTRDYGYWVENQLRERFELEGVPVVDRLRPPRMKVASSSAAGSWGTAFARLLRRPRPRGDARLPRRRPGARDRGDGPQPALPARRHLAGVARRCARRGAARGGRARRGRRAEPRRSGRSSLRCRAPRRCSA